MTTKSNINSGQRHIATLRMPKDANQTSLHKDWYSYSPSSIVSTMHSTPRFGYSNHLGLVISSNPDAPMKYAQGIKQFTLFYLVVPFVVWTSFLWILKCLYGKRRVGCAAGGEVLDMYALSKPPLSLSRKQRKRRIVRSWRVQSVFLIASILVPLVSIVMMTVGLSTMNTAINELQVWLSDVETLALGGWMAMDGILLSKHGLLDPSSDNEIIRGILLDYHQHNSRSSNDTTQHSSSSSSSSSSINKQSDQEQQLVDEFLQQHHHDSFLTTPVNATDSNQLDLEAYPLHGVFINTFCPGATMYTAELDFFMNAMETVEDNTHTMMKIFDQFESDRSSSTSFLDSSFFRVIAETTISIDTTLEWFLSNDWLLKLLVMALNVVNLLLLLNVYLLSKNNIIHRPARLYVTYILMPLLLLFSFTVFIITMLTGMASQIIADFCAGGPQPGSVKGTLQDSILSLEQYGNLDPTHFHKLNHSIATFSVATNLSPMTIAYAAIEYYASGCFSNNPLQFLDTLAVQMDAAVAHVNHLSSMLLDVPQNNTTNITTLDETCGQDMSFLYPALYDLNDKLGKLQSNLHQLVETASCNQVSPLLRRLSHGAVCIELPYGLTVLWSCAFCLLLLCFIMITTRAALYNAVLPKKTKKKKPRRIVEKEFIDYQEYMAQYYEETEKWKLDEPLPLATLKAKEAKTSKICLEFDDALQAKLTFETAISSNSSSEEENMEDIGISTDDDNCAVHVRASSQFVDSDEKVSNLDVIPEPSVHLSNLREDESYGSEYESECSDERNKDDGDGLDSIVDDEEQSAMMSFISETKSLALQTIHSLQFLKPLLTHINPMLPTSHIQDDSKRDEDDFSFQSKEIGGIDSSDIVADPLEPSKYEKSMYLATTSMCDPPGTPGLHPVFHKPLLENQHDDHDDERNVVPFWYKNPYLGQTSPSVRARKKTLHPTSTSMDDGLLKQTNNKLPSWFGQSVRHRNRVATYKSFNPFQHLPEEKKEDQSPACDGPRLFQVLSTPLSVISALTPSAPYKPFSFTKRTKKEPKEAQAQETFDDLYTHEDNGEANGSVFEDSSDDEERDAKPSFAKTPCRGGGGISALSVFSLSPGVDSMIRPTILELSPLLVPLPHVKLPSHQLPTKRDHPTTTTAATGPFWKYHTAAQVAAPQKQLLYPDDSKDTEEGLEREEATSSVQELVRRFENNNNTITRNDRKEVTSVRRKTTGLSSFSQQHVRGIGRSGGSTGHFHHYNHDKI